MKALALTERAAQSLIAAPRLPPSGRVIDARDGQNIRYAMATSVDRALTEPGSPLSPALQTDMGRRFSQDFSAVRVHTGPIAALSAQQLAAAAYTVGDDIVFGAGRFTPHSASGRRLLAHELGHVAQQRVGGPSSRAPVESRASAAADRVARGGEVLPGHLGGAPKGLYRSPDDSMGHHGAPSTPSLPPIPNFRLSTPGPAEWLQIQATLGAHGVRLSQRDADDILRERERSSRLLDTFGIDDRFKLWFITKQWILNKGIQTQVEDWQMRENPNRFDRLNLDWKSAHPGGWQTPIVPIYHRDF